MVPLWYYSSSKSHSVCCWAITSPVIKLLSVNLLMYTDTLYNVQKRHYVTRIRMNGTKWSGSLVPHALRPHSVPRSERTGWSVYPKSRSSGKSGIWLTVFGLAEPTPFWFSIYNLVIIVNSLVGIVHICFLRMTFFRGWIFHRNWAIHIYHRSTFQLIFWILVYCLPLYSIYCSRFNMKKESNSSISQKRYRHPC